MSPSGGNVSWGPPYPWGINDGIIDGARTKGLAPPPMGMAPGGHDADLYSPAGTGAITSTGGAPCWHDSAMASSEAAARASGET